MIAKQFKYVLKHALVCNRAIAANSQISTSSKTQGFDVLNPRLGGEIVAVK